MVHALGHLRYWDLMIDANPAVRQTGFAENWLARCYTTRAESL